MRIAVIGTGISGLVCARLLALHHEVTVFEAEPRIGGHSHTARVTLTDQPEELAIDTGFIVYNERTYPKFTQILADLNVATQPTHMSFSVRCDASGLEYNGTSLNGLFAQRRNLCRPSFWKMLRDIWRFNREGSADYQSVPPEQSVGDYLAEKGYSAQFREHYLLPMGAAIWSCPGGEFARFPIGFILQFFLNHGLLDLRHRPTWRVIQGGSQAYVARLAQPLAAQIRLACPIQSVRRLEHEVRVQHSAGTESFDEIVVACHSDQALRMLDDADATEREILSEFPYAKNVAVLHTDASVLPFRKRAWACWNYRLTGNPTSPPTVTYNMNLLQNLASRQTFCVTLNDTESIDPARMLAQFHYSHPLFTTRRQAVQERHQELIRHRRSSFCGAYWRNGFHEDGVVSALRVCRDFGIPDWTAATRQPYSTTQQGGSPAVATTTTITGGTD